MTKRAATGTRTNENDLSNNTPKPRHTFLPPFHLHRPPHLTASSARFNSLMLLPPKPPKTDVLAQTLRKPSTTTDTPPLRTMRPRTPIRLILLLLLVRLQLVFAETAQYRSSDRTEESVPDLVSAKPARKTARDGAAEAAFAIFAFLGWELGGSGGMLA